MSPEAAESLRVIEQWASRGLVFYNELATRSTKTRAVCPECFHGLRDRGVSVQCAACGWEKYRGPA